MATVISNAFHIWPLCINRLMTSQRSWALLKSKCNLSSYMYNLGWKPLPNISSVKKLWSSDTWKGLLGTLALTGLSSLTACHTVPMSNLLKTGLRLAPGMQSKRYIGSVDECQSSSFHLNNIFHFVTKGMRQGKWNRDKRFTEANLGCKKGPTLCIRSLKRTRVSKAKCRGKVTAWASSCTPSNGYKKWSGCDNILSI